jgi:hypothetical protein
LRLTFIALALLATAGCGAHVTASTDPLTPAPSTTPTHSGPATAPMGPVPTPVGDPIPAGNLTLTECAIDAPISTLPTNAHVHVMLQTDMTRQLVYRLVIALNDSRGEHVADIVALYRDIKPGTEIDDVPQAVTSTGATPGPATCVVSAATQAES